MKAVTLQSMIKINVWIISNKQDSLINNKSPEVKNSNIYEQVSP